MEFQRSIPFHPRSHAYPPPPPPPPAPPWKSPHSIGISSTPVACQFRFGLLSLRPPRYGYAKTIRNRKFDFNSRRFDDDEDFDGIFDRRRRRRRRRGGRKRWWSDDVPDDTRTGILDEVIDGIWFLKVLRSYGWFLPVILLSLLVATGPKAFFMASSIPLGISLLTLTFTKLWEWLEGSPKPRPRHKSRSPFGRANRYWRKRGYPSWVAGEDSSAHRSSSGDRASVSSFGGWDELVGEEETEVKLRSSREMDKPEILVERVKLSRSLEEKDLPLLLRLLVAIFPFLGSWTSLL